jgi:hypothetical protein
MEKEVTLRANLYTLSQTDSSIGFYSDTAEPYNEEGLPVKDFFEILDQAILSWEFESGQEKSEK